jgi:hypothetical protein
VVAVILVIAKPLGKQAAFGPSWLWLKIMKTSRAPFLTAVMGLAVLSLAVCSCRAKDTAQPQNPPSAPPDSTPPPAPSAPSNKGDAAQEDPADTTAATTWAAIKDYTYDRRSDFIAGLSLMGGRLDAGMQVLNAKRATMTDGAAKDWDFNMKELHNARDYLQSTSSDLEKATDSTWADAKDKVSQAWERVRNAYDKVRHSTTS